VALALRMSGADADAVMRERRELRRRLSAAVAACRPGGGAPPPAPSAAAAGAGGGGAGPGGAAGPVDPSAALQVEACLAAVEASLGREARVLGTLSWTLAALVDPEPLGACVLRSWCAPAGERGGRLGSVGGANPRLPVGARGGRGRGCRAVDLPRAAGRAHAAPRRVCRRPSARARPTDVRPFWPRLPEILALATDNHGGRVAQARY
jgi:hypothetical protein